jgi:hypothetical protein
MKRPAKFKKYKKNKHCVKSKEMSRYGNKNKNWLYKFLINNNRIAELNLSSYRNKKMKPRLFNK